MAWIASRYSSSERTRNVFRGFRRPTATIAWLESSAPIALARRIEPRQAASSPRTHTHFRPYQLLLEALFLARASRIYTDVWRRFFPTYDVANRFFLAINYFLIIWMLFSIISNRSCITRYYSLYPLTHFTIWTFFQYFV